MRASVVCSIIQQDLQQLSWQKIRIGAVKTGNACNSFRRSLYLNWYILPESLTCFQKKLNQRSWHLMTCSNKHPIELDRGLRSEGDNSLACKFPRANYWRHHSQAMKQKQSTSYHRVRIYSNSTCFCNPFRLNDPQENVPMLQRDPHFSLWKRKRKSIHPPRSQR